MIDYNNPLYRPPAEASSLIIQITLGCSYNKCSFCTMYENKEYKVRKLDDILDEIEVMATLYPDTQKIFLADGDALNLDTKHLLKILEFIQESFLSLRRVSIYASAFNLLKKTKEELIELRENKLSLIYYGIESGDYELLKAINKTISPLRMIEGLNKASEAGMKISAMVILGLGGKKRSVEHIKNTALLINHCKISYLSTLQLGLEESKEEFFYNFYKKNLGEFEFLNLEEILKEQASLISLLNPSKTLIFRSNHVSNILPLKGNLPRDKNRLISEIRDFLSNSLYDLTEIDRSFE